MLGRINSYLWLAGFRDISSGPVTVAPGVADFVFLRVELPMIVVDFSTGGKNLLET